VTDTQAAAAATATATAEQRERGPNGVEGGDAPALDAAAIQALIEERDGYKNELLRTAADFTNFRRRTEQEFATFKQVANRDLLRQLLDVLDDFERALAQVPEEQRESGWVSGMAMIDRKLGALLERAGAARIESLGQPFDPALHEAVASDPGSDGSTVVEVYRQGYRLGEGLLRPAMVKVGGRESRVESRE
jgi:molecular chaperone GrpE